MSSHSLVPRAGEIIISLGTSSSGDDARTVNIPFGTLAANGRSISLPSALKLSVQSNSNIPISGSDVVCQAFKDAKGTQVLGSSFTQSESSTLGPEPITIGSIFCSDAENVRARLGSDDASAQASSTGFGEATSVETQSTQTETVSATASVISAVEPSSTAELQQTTPSPSAAIDPTGNDAKPNTVQQTSDLAITTSIALSSQSNIGSSSVSGSDSSAASKRPTSLSSVTSAVTSTLPPAASSSSAAAAQNTSGASNIRTSDIWTVKRLINVSILAACYMGWFMT